ncbi:MAG: hypothetical protein HKN83_08385 [Gammaproteobacteria bacterium]|nr:hypothetical protein [Gammaproteobacteria bacterium]
MTTISLRENLIDLLRAIASIDKQLGYEKRAPIANVSDELICGWFDDLYRPNTKLFEAAFNSQERRELDRFNYFFEKCVESISNSSKLIDLQTSDEWKQIRSLANDTITKCGWDE